MGISSCGLVAVLRDLLNYKPPYNIDICLFCPPGYTKNIPFVNKDIKIIETEYAVESKISKVIGSSYSQGLIRLVESYDPNAVFYITGSYKKGLEKYESYFILNNQLYTDYSLLYKQQNIKLAVYMSIISIRFRHYIRNIDHVFFSSEFSKLKTEKVVPITDSKVVPFACNSIFYKDAQIKSSYILRDNIRILCIGSIIPYKNQLSIIKAVNNLIEKGYGVDLRLIGSIISKKYYNACNEYIKDKRIEKNVNHICNLPLDKIPHEIDNCDIYVNASETDTCGTAVEEGMARGAVVIANDTGFNREMMGDSGLYFDVKKPDTLSDAIEKVINDADMQNILRNKAFVKARERTLKDTASDYYEYIRKNNR